MAVKRKTSGARTPAASKPTQSSAPSRRSVPASAKPATTKPAAAKRAKAKPATTKRASSARVARVAEKPTKRSRATSGADKPSRRGKLTGSGGPSPAGMFQKIAFTMFEIEDAVRARAFYEGVLGFTRGLASPEGTWTEYDLPGGGCLALFRHPNQKSGRAGGGACVALEVSDLDALNRHLKKAGVVYKGDMVHGPHCRMCNILDSEGNTLILHQLDHA